MPKAESIENVNVLKAAIKRATPPTMIRVNDGLYLQIASKGAMSWLLRYQISGRRREMGLGSFPEVGLAAASADALAQRGLVTKGIDPIEKRRTERAAEVERKAQEAARKVTFNKCAAEYIASHSVGWRNPKQALQWRSSLKAYAAPVIGEIPPAEITTEHVLEILNPIWQTVPETASRVRNRIELVWDSAKAKKLCSGENPARWRGHLDKLLPKRSKVRRVKHFNALPWPELPAFWQALGDKTCDGSRALRIAILTACRTNEVLGAEWSEFDLTNKTWTIPDSRMKAGEPHRVPLSNAVVALLKSEIGRHQRFVFPHWSKPDAETPVSNMTMLMALRRMGRKDITVHGFRSTFRDWCAEETHHARDVCEMALAHKIESDVESAYRRGDLLEKRRALMNDWAAYVTRRPAKNVVKLPSRRA